MKRMYVKHTRASTADFDEEVCQLRKSWFIIVSRSKLLLLIGGGIAFLLLILIIGYVILFGRSSGATPVVLTTKAITLEFWGVFDDSDVYQPIIDAYQKKHPNISIHYRKFLYDDYEGNLISALASRKGPDIFMVHNTWLSKHQDKLDPSPAPPSSIYSQAFTSQTAQDFVRSNKVYAYPLFIDNLALFYNRDLFAKEGFSEPPLDWDQFSKYVKALTRFSPNGDLLHSGAAIGGSSKTINRATDILLLLFLQNGVEPIDSIKKEIPWKNDPTALASVKDAIRFYAAFADPSDPLYTWNERQQYSIDAFYTGNVAMMFNYAYNIPVIKAKAPYLNFAVARLPRKGGSITLTNYWGAGVSNQAAFKKEAWDFLDFLTSKEQYQGYIQTTGRLSSRSDILETQKDDPLLNPFIQQARDMVTPYQPDEVKLQSIFDELILSATARSATLEEALHKTADRLQLLVQ